ncbi:hypothetical protein MGG_15550 [Pyricularia oryzae 70-15]|uniref:Uncharacterized protein n=2 Tax=Pyricularia oryzae TaxID=318829 RepID=G4MT92_PYRO7|nr:uncharacterized protein MGG_15550 [Pyricularia oryzae 70-15]EHA53838.1 hypothetical protein MGG_15550 [Pyricularia oryzae 70-15]ELQ34666.1 hypothetical protein OOU_Y34scaffold00749g1 [Pyricularia oryzae Y34]
MQIWYVPAIVLPSQDDVVLTCKLADKATLRGTYRYSDGPERQRPAHLVVGSFKSSNQDTRSADVLPGRLGHHVRTSRAAFLHLIAARIYRIYD